MANRAEGSKRQAEPKLDSIELGVLAPEIMDGIEAAIAPKPVVGRQLLANYLNGRRNMTLVYRDKGKDITIDGTRKRERNGMLEVRSMSVHLSFPNSEAPLTPHIWELELSGSKPTDNPERPFGSVKTTIDGEVYENDRTAVQNAQRFITLLS